MAILLKLLVTLLCAYLAVVLAAWLGQRRLIYVPNPARYSPTAAGLPQAIEQIIETGDGAQLVAWRVAAAPGKPTILYFHGNAGGLVNRAARAGRYARHGYGMLLVSYRGYSGSTGSPSETANVEDARRAYDALRREGVAASDIFVYGESLGSGVAVQLAAQVPVAGVILDAPYSSMIEMAALRFPMLPARYLLSDRYETTSHIRRVTAPVLVLHGAKDELIPLAMGETVHRAAPGVKRLAVFPSGFHTDLDSHGAVETVTAWIEEIRSGEKR